MSSTFTWLDYSERDRRKMLDIVDMFRDKDTVDELGVGGIRDALADIFFPGLSTIQTRARYFFFVPWIYLKLEREKTPSSEIAAKARKMEIDLIGALGQSVKEEFGKTDGHGIIGIEAGATLKRLPSNVYWLGLSKYKMRLNRYSQENYHRSLNSFYKFRHEANSSERDASEVEAGTNWDTAMPNAPEGFPKRASLNFTATESNYLSERIQMNAPKSLFAFFVEHLSESENTEFFWDHPKAGKMSEKLANQVEHARNFSETMHGAALLYNLLLSETKKNDEWIAFYRDSIAEWRAGIEARRDALARWNVDEFWFLVKSQNPRVSPHTQEFVQNWILFALASRDLDLCESRPAREALKDREARLKKSLARLTNQHALEMWNGASGTTRLNYRWNVAQRMLNDILRGQNGEVTAHA